MEASASAALSTWLWPSPSSLSFSLSLSSLQKITHPWMSTCPSGPKATQSCTKNSSAHNKHTLFFSTYTRMMACSFYHQITTGFGTCTFIKSQLFSQQVFIEAIGFRDSIGEGDMLLCKIVNSWCNHCKIVLLFWNVIETSVFSVLRK